MKPFGRNKWCMMASQIKLTSLDISICTQSLIPGAGAKRNKQAAETTLEGNRELRGRTMRRQNIPRQAHRQRRR
jgi:hypothetical protein